MEACPLLVPIMMTTDGYPADIQVHKRLKFCSEYWLHAGIIVETIHLLLGDSQCKLKHLRFVLKLLKKKTHVFSISGGLRAADGFHHTSAAKPIPHRFHPCYMTEVKSTK